MASANIGAMFCNPNKQKTNKDTKIRYRPSQAAEAAAAACTMTFNLGHFLTFSVWGMELVTTNSRKGDSSIRFKAGPAQERVSD